MVNNYFLYNFIEREYKEKSNSFQFILWVALKNYNNKKAQISQHIKKELEDKYIYQENFYEKITDIISSKGYTSYEDSLDSVPEIDSIQVKNFKGFGELSNEDQGTFIDFIKDKNIFFSPNGGGKTSLCNALEYKITGNIKEAEKRGLSVSEYIKRNNSRYKIDMKFQDKENTFSASDLSEKQQQVLNHAFIEHNRINAFALLGSRDSKDRHEDIISSVIGLEDLDEFISYFIKPESLQLNDYITNANQNALSETEQTIRNKNEKIQTNDNLIKSQKDELKDSLELKNETELKQDTVMEKIQEIDNNIKQIDEDFKAWYNKSDISDVDFLKSVHTINIIKKDLKRFEEIDNVVQENISKVNLTDLFKGLNTKIYG